MNPIEVHKIAFAFWDSVVTTTTATGGIQDMNFISTGFDEDYSNLLFSWVTVGTPGSKIFKFQIKSNDITSNVNMQICLYEVSNKIEIHWGTFGSSVNTDLSAFILYKGHSTSTSNNLGSVYSNESGDLFYLTGNSDSPLNNCFSWSDSIAFNKNTSLEDAQFTAFPPTSGRIYVFTAK